MAPLAITLGLEPLDPAERKRVPRRVRLTDVLSSEGVLPQGTIYVGRGHHSHRLPTTKELLHCREGDSLESGGEDWPNAYRHSPMGVRESHGCVVTFWHHGWGQPAFQIYAGLNLGSPWQ